MSVCGGWSLVRHRHIGTEATALFCRSWLCPDCSPRRKANLIRTAVDGQPTTFLTLTINPAQGENPDERAQTISDAFKVLIKRARRKFTKGVIEYLAVFEQTKRGEPHLHILLRAPFIPQRWLSAQMAELINSPIVDIRKVGRARNAALYLGKYLTKGPKPFKNMKRYWTSQGYDLNGEWKKAKKDRADTGWRVWQSPLWEIVEVLQTHHIEAVWLDEHNVFFKQRAGPNA